MVDHEQALQAALRYAEFGWPVLPLHSVREGACTCRSLNCNSPAKHPRTPKGLKDATTHVLTIESWWQTWPDANIGVRTGAESATVVIDVDPRHGGAESLAQLHAEQGELPATVEALTGGGGRHLFFAHPGGLIRNRANVWPGVDVRADGGYVVAPPSTHVSGNLYAWREGRGPDEIEPARLPDWLLTALRPPNANGEPPAPRLATTAETALLDAARRYVAKADPFGEGGRNNAAFRLAGHLHSFVAQATGEGLSESEILDAVRTWNSRNTPPLSEVELLAAVRSAMTNGTPRHPHVVPVPQDRTDKTDKSPSVGFVGPDSQVEEKSWPDPQPLPDALPAVAPFHFDLLPVSLRPWIEDIAERIQCPPDYPAVAAMIAVASLVGRKVGIRPKRQDDWLVVPNLWGVAIGPPSVMKTPAIQEPLRPLRRLEIEAKAKFEDDMALFQAAAMVAKQRRKAAETDITMALKKGEDADAIARDALADAPRSPVRRRYLVNDSTVEKLGELLNENANGVLCFRDELIGLLKSLEKDGQEGARAFYLEAWNGAGRYTYDRIGRGTIDIEYAIVSIIGSIQPGPLYAYLRGALAGGADADGLMQRFQLAVWPDVPPDWRNVDRRPNREARECGFSVFQRLDALDPSDVHAGCDDFDVDGIPFLRFSGDAQDIFDDWRAKLELRLRREDEHPAVVCHLAKYRSLVPTLALLIHVVDEGAGPVDVDAIGRAARWAAYLESHARRIFAPVVTGNVMAARALAHKILNGAVLDGFALRDVYRKGWNGLSTKDEVRDAAELLIDFDWLEARSETTPGRTRTRHHINPNILRGVREGADKTDKSLTASLSSVLSVRSERNTPKTESDAVARNEVARSAKGAPTLPEQDEEVVEWTR